jgi:hypothetical protein
MHNLIAVDIRQASTHTASTVNQAIGYELYDRVPVKLAHKIHGERTLLSLVINHSRRFIFKVPEHPPNKQHASVNILKGLNVRGMIWGNFQSFLVHNSTLICCDDAIKLI